MKKKILILVLLCGIAFTVLSLFIIKNIPKQRTTYELSPKMSEALFGKTPEEFFNTFYDYYNYCEDFRDRAEIKDGNLILHLTKWQERSKLLYSNRELKMFEKIDGVEIGDDYTFLTIKGTESELKKIVWEEMPLYLVFDMGNRQLFSGKDPETIKVTVTLIDEKTEDIVYTATWPDEAIKFSFDKK